MSNISDIKLYIINKLLTIPIILIALTVHEISHGYAAYKLGDPTGRIGHGGYCSYPEYEFDMREVNRYCVNPEPEKIEPKRARDDGR